jgi:hypothetical protein
VTSVVELGTDGKKMAGSAEPQPDKCASRLTKPKPNWPAGMVRYCTLEKGHGTSHKGIGTCKFHLGSVRTHVRAAERVKVAATLEEISKSLGTPAPLRDPYIELWDLVATSVQWKKILEAKMAELTSLQVTDISGQEHSREIIALWERASDRTGDFLLKMTKIDLRRKVMEIQSEHGQAISELMNAVRDDDRLQLTDEQIKTFNDVFREKFPQVEDRLFLRDIPEIPMLELEGEEMAVG